MADSMWTKKAGPLPMWGWGAVGLGGALAWNFVQRGRTSKKDDQDQGEGTDVDTVPADQVPDFISQNYITINNPTPGAAPPPATTPPTTPPKTTTPPPKTTKPPPKKSPKAIQYRVKHGDTLSSIAKAHGTTWQALWKYNTTAGVRPADTIKTLKSRGPNLLYANELVLIPPKK